MASPTRRAPGSQVAAALLRGLGIDLGETRILGARLTMYPHEIAALDLDIAYDARGNEALADACRAAGLVVNLYLVDRTP